MNSMPLDEEGSSLNWARHEAEILDLFVTRNKTLKEVKKHMEEEHGLVATERQYKYRFHRLKNVSEEDYGDIDDECRRRAAIGKETVVYLHGRPLPLDRLKRGIDRVQKNRPKRQVAKRKDKDPGRITFRTPSPAPVPISNRATPQLRDPQTSRTAQGLRIVSTTKSPMLLGSPSGASQQQPSQRVIGPDDVGIDTTVDLGDATRKSQSDISTEAVNWPQRTVSLAGGLEPDHRATTHGRHSSPSAQEAVSLHRGGADLHLSSPDTHHDRTLMSNLPFFRLLHEIGQPGYPWPTRPLPSRTSGHDPTPAATSNGFLILARSVFPGASDSTAELLSTTTVAEIASSFRILIPERYDGDLVHKLERVLDPSLPISATLPWLFSVAAFLATNNGLMEDQMDAFLQWIIDQGHAVSLDVFMSICTPTVRAFSEVLSDCSIRIRNVQVLDILLGCGVKLESKLLEIAQNLGDAGLAERVLANADPASLARGNGGANTFHYFVKTHRFDLARLLLEKGVSVDARSSDLEGSSLHQAIAGNNTAAIKFLLDAGANADLLVACTRDCSPRCWTSILGYAVFKDNVEAVVLLLEHGADPRTTIHGKPLLEWAALSSRTIYDLLRKRMVPPPVGFLLGDLVDAANHGPPAFAAYLAQHPMEVTKHQLEKALQQSILRDHLMAAITLLQGGVSPDGLTLDTCPLVSALSKQSTNPLFVGLLLGHNADLGRSEILSILSSKGPNDLLEIALAFWIDREHKMKALERAAGSGNLVSAAILIRTGLDVDTPGLLVNPLQAACSLGHTDMMRFLIDKGANVNAPAHQNDGRTALQAALESKNPVESARILLDHGADVSAPPARWGGRTALEALCHNEIANNSEDAWQLCHRLLDAGATVNRPEGKASSALHGIIRNGWHGVLARCLEPQHNAIVNHIWRHDSFDYTPTQLAATKGDLTALTTLLGHGADVNEAPVLLAGRTALQAAALLKPGPEKMAVVDLLLRRGADINAPPAGFQGVTAIQAAATSGDLLLARLFISRGADVNELPFPYPCDGAIERAAKHGRLDMVQLLLNAGATGITIRGTGFQRAVELAEQNGHFAVAGLLKGAR